MNAPSHPPSSPATPNDADRRDSKLVALRWPLALSLTAIVLSGFALLAYWLTLSQAAAGGRAARDAAGAMADRAGEIAGAFFSGDVTESFLSSMPELDRSGTGRLEVASAVITETLSRSDERRVAWDLLPLGKTTVEIEVPVTYRYHVAVQGEWKIEIRGPVCLVSAPALTATLPPAIHTDRLRTRTEESMLRFDAGEQMLDLQRSLTPRLSQRAESPQYRDLMREEARRAVANFVRTFLLDQDYWRDDAFATIKVSFADESEDPGPAAQEPGFGLEISGELP
ncbi:MAG: hypothetical protein AAF725_05070 [Acidobacteriota bacterium]